MPNGKQIRAARVLLDWSAEDLAEKVGVSRVTIQNIENEVNKRPYASTSNKIAEVFEDAGIEFTEGNGVKKRAKDAEIFEGKERFDDFCNFMYGYLQKHGGEVLISATDERYLQTAFSDLLHHRAVMMSLKERRGVGGRILVSDGNFQRTWADIRRRSEGETKQQVSFICFGNCLALIAFEHDPAPYVILCHSLPIADEYRRTFDAAWERAEEI